MKIRLDKYLADMGLGTRSEVKNAIKSKCVTVNGTIVKGSDIKIDTEVDQVSFKGKIIGYAQYEYYMLHKPAGVVSATEDQRDQTVLDLLKDKKRKDLFPVGRLDKDTEGLLLITNDGDLAHRLLSPKKHVQKTYFAIINKKVTQEDVLLFEKGLKVDDEFTALPAKLKILETYATDGEGYPLHEASKVTIEICEGKYHQIKRMFEAVDKKVMYLKRLSMGSLVLDENLGLGEYRALTDQELEELKKHA